MIKIQLDNTDYDIKGVTLNQYEKVQQKSKDGKMEDDDFISLMTGIDRKKIRQATMQQIKFVAKVLDNYLNNQSNQNLRPLILTGKEVLGLINPSQMSYGEFVDLETLMSMQPRNLKHIAAILYRPTVNYDKETNERTLVKYDYEECEKRQEQMGELFLSDILAGLFFLTKFNQILVDDSLSSLENKMKMKAG